MISRYWPSAFRRRYLRERYWPQHFLILDIETTGLDVRVDLPVQVGAVKVSDGQVVETAGFLVNWLAADGSPVEPDNFIRRYKATRDMMQRNGKGDLPSLERLQREGVQPSEAFARLSALMDWRQQQDAFLAGHNCVRYDLPLLHNTCQRCKHTERFLLEDRVWDTALLEKSWQLWQEGDLSILPKTHETLLGYWQRVADRRAYGIRFSLDFCLQRYLSGPSERRHDAVEDALLVWNLLQCWQQETNA